MNLSRRLRAPALLITALAALLVFAATAAAETRTGESTSSFALAPSSPEAALVKGAASYETAGGTVVFNITTAAPPESENKPSATEMTASLFTTSGECSSGIGTVYSALLGGASGVSIVNIYPEPTAPVFIGPLVLILEGGGGGLPPTGLATKSVSGSTTTLSFTSGSIVEQGYNCALILVLGEGGESLMAFPVKAPPPPPAPPAPAPAPPVLSIAKPKPLKLKAKAWKTVHVKVKNTGATATTQGSLRVKPAKGVLVKPEVQKLPILTPSATFTLSVRVQLTEKAKPKSKLPVTVTAPGVTATSSIILNLKK